MLRPDVIDLSQFYTSPLGHVTRRLIRRRVRELWPDTTGLRVLGMGYATPFLRPFRDQAERVIAIMPANQGVLPWPPEDRRLVALADETEMPLADSSVDRVLLVHGLETSEQARALLRDVWRVLTPSGRVLVVVPNRRGIWARLERTPFGHGWPYSAPQLTRLLREAMFTPSSATGALYLPPARWPSLLRTANAWERMGHRWWQGFSGVVIVEAGKQMYAISSARGRRRRARAVIALPQAAQRDVAAATTHNTRQ